MADMTSRPASDSSLVEGQRPQSEAKARFSTRMGKSVREGTSIFFRHDIQGLRGVAVLLVVLYHCGYSFVAGGYVGVDVFFVISGFLITLKLLEGIERTGRLEFTSFYASRVRRLLPHATVVIVVTLALARWVGPITGIRSTASDAIASAASVMNYWLITRNVEYLHAEQMTSPLAHYWSLGVEEQFYLVWPMLLATCAWFAGRHMGKLARAVLIALAVLAALSLGFSVASTDHSPTLAYYSLHTRAWELAVGGMLAATSRELRRLPSGMASMLAWVGLATVFSTAFFFNDQTVFPGYAALLPVLGTAMVIAANMRPRGSWPIVLLGSAPMMFLGKHSYGWYLWHWPMITLLPFVFEGRDRPVHLVGYCGIALVLAVVTHYAVERPTLGLSLSLGRWLYVGTGVLAATVVASLAITLTMPRVQGNGVAVTATALEEKTSEDEAESRLATELEQSLAATNVPMNLRPQLDQAQQSLPRPIHDGCHLDFLDVDQPACVYGDPGGARTAVLYGDSHAGHWFPALDKLAKVHGVRLYAWTKAGCPVADVDFRSSYIGREYTECSQWRTARQEELSHLRPDMVIVSQADAMPEDQVTDSEWAEATVAAMERLRSNGSDVTYLLDTPAPEPWRVECVTRNLSDVGNCSYDEQAATDYPARRDALRLALTASGVTLVDPNKWLCVEGKCPAVVSNLLVFRDRAHLTTEYSEYLAPMFEPVLRRG